MCSAGDSGGLEGRREGGVSGLGPHGLHDVEDGRGRDVQPQ